LQQNRKKSYHSKSQRSRTRQKRREVRILVKKKFPFKRKNSQRSCDLKPVIGLWVSAETHINYGGGGKGKVWVGDPEVLRESSSGEGNAI